MNLYYIILLGLAVSLDALFAGIAYGIKKIQIPILSLTAISLSTLIYTGIATFGSNYIVSIITPQTASVIGAALLITIGCVHLIKQYELSVYTEKHLSSDNIFISIMEKPERADMDSSNRLSIIEALFLGTALGIDNMIATFAAGLAKTIPIYTPIIMCIIQTALLLAGITAAQRIISPSLQKKLIYMPGIVLIFIGLTKLL